MAIKFCTDCGKKVKYKFSPPKFCSDCGTPFNASYANKKTSISEKVEKIKNTVSSHVEYWKSKKLDHYQGGPFSDRTGGLITFASENLEEAADLINHDPFIKNDVIDKLWLKEWMPE